MKSALFAVALSLALTALADIDDGLIAYYKFDGSLQDSSASAYHGSNYTGSVTFGPGRNGLAAVFDGKSCISIPAPRLLDGYSNATISAWVYFSGSGSGQIVSAGDSRSGMDPITTRISPSTADDCRFNQTRNNTQVLLGFDNGESLPGLSAKNWHLFTVALDSSGGLSTFTCYVDGSLIKSVSNPEFQAIAYDVDMPALIGALDATSPWQFWGGMIDDLRIYGRKLSESEIAELYGQAQPGLTIVVSQVKLCWSAPTNSNWQMQFRSAATGGAWQNLGGVIVGTGATDCMTDETGESQKSYRLISVP